MIIHNTIAFALLGSSFIFGCGHSDDHAHGNEGEVITTLQLSFVPVADGETVVATFDDPDGDGGNPPTNFDSIVLAPTMYTLDIRFENRLESPPEDITIEVDDESHEHQIFFTGTAVTGPASEQPNAPLVHSYGDQDDNGLPIGLTNSIAANTGKGVLVVTLRHLPPVGGTGIKTAMLSALVAEGGFDNIGGKSDVQVSFDVTVQ